MIIQELYKEQKDGYYRILVNKDNVESILKILLELGYIYRSNIIDINDIKEYKYEMYIRISIITNYMQVFPAKFFEGDYYNQTYYLENINLKNYYNY